MFSFIKRIFNKFFGYLGNNNCEFFKQISHNDNDEFECSGTLVNVQDILKKKKTKVDANNSDNSGIHYRDKDKERRESQTIELVQAKNKYVKLVKRQRMAQLLKGVTKAITGALFPKKEQKVDRDILMYKLQLITVKMQILKAVNKRYNVNISKSVAYLDEGMGTFVSRVKYGMKRQQRSI